MTISTSVPIERPGSANPIGQSFLEIRKLAMNGGIMGLLSKLFGGVDKSALIKDLVRLRIRSDAMASAMGFDEGMVNSLSTFQLAGLPEGTIVTIVETWTKLRKYGATDPDIFRRIEDHRSMAFPRGEMPSPLNLTSYTTSTLSTHTARHWMTTLWSPQLRSREKPMKRNDASQVLAGLESASCPAYQEWRQTVNGCLFMLRQSAQQNSTRS